MKSLPVVSLASARADLARVLEWYELEAGEKVAGRFAQGFDRTLLAVGANAELSPLIGSTAPAFQSMRKRPVSGFPNYLIFYRIGTTAVEIVRLLHSSQDWFGEFDVE